MLPSDCMVVVTVVAVAVVVDVVGMQALQSNGHCLTSVALYISSVHWSSTNAAQSSGSPAPLHNPVVVVVVVVVLVVNVAVPVVIVKVVLVVTQDTCSPAEL